MNRGILRIAVTSVSGASGYGIIQCARLLPYPVETYPIDITPHSVGLWMGTQPGTVLPKPERDIGAWIEFVERNEIDALIPGADRDLIPISEHRDELCAIVSRPDVIAIADDKYKTARYLQSIGVLVPDFALAEESKYWVRFPCVVKPRSDAASRGFHVCADREELNFYLKRTNKPMIQEFIDADEYTCNVFVDRDGEPVAHLSMLRKERSGIAIEARPVEDEDIRRMLFKIARALKPMGTLSVQLRKVLDVPLPFEINARMSGSSIVRAMAGYNDLQMMLDHYAFGKKIGQPRIDYTQTYFRWYDAASVATRLMAFSTERV